MEVWSASGVGRAEQSGDRSVECIGAEGWIGVEQIGLEWSSWHPLGRTLVTLLLRIAPLARLPSFSLTSVLPAHAPLFSLSPPTSVLSARAPLLSSPLPPLPHISVRPVSPPSRTRQTLARRGEPSPRPRTPGLTEARQPRRRAGVRAAARKHSGGGGRGPKPEEHSERGRAGF